MNEKLNSFIKSIFDETTLQQAVLSSPREKNTGPDKIMIRPIMIKNNLVYQLSLYQNQKVFHENYDPKTIQEAVLKLLSSYKQALFCTPDNDFHILINKKGDVNILKKQASKPSLKVTSHNRPKNYCLPEGKAVSFLVELGIMSASGKVYAQKYDKFRQINRFLEMIEDVVNHLPKDKVLQIIDFGCGKAYLTFALYHYLHIIHGHQINIIGLDLKKEVVEHCQSIADQLQFSHLQFIHGDINTYTEAKNIDLMVCLHACNTATDAALEKAVEWNSKVIMAVPCCQHELFNQIENTSLTPLLKHGILKERFAALATDAARAQILEIAGYKTQIMEFIDLEHTPKNLLIRAVRLDKPINRKKLIEEYHQYKQSLKIKPNIEDRLLKYLY